LQVCRESGRTEVRRSGSTCGMVKMKDPVFGIPRRSCSENGRLAALGTANAQGHPLKLVTYPCRDVLFCLQRRKSLTGKPVQNRLELFTCHFTERLKPGIELIELFDSCSFSGRGGRGFPRHKRQNCKMIMIEYQICLSVASALRIFGRATLHAQNGLPALVNGRRLERDSQPNTAPGTGHFVLLLACAHPSHATVLAALRCTQIF